ncbi:MAG TPA: GtrA family protein [Gammaproteobacteria bacterium]|jgi:putative flippase GtrA|nr:GtrA family protein [Gammaproteobacteria bacterium]
MILLARYITVGVLAVGVHFSLMLVLVELFGVMPWVASFLGFCFGSLVNYSLLHSWAFQSTRAHGQALSRYIAVTLSMLVLNLFILRLLHESVGVDYRLAQVVATGTVFMANFSINSRFTFQSS